MESPLFLTDSELRELTGRKLRTLQIAALRDMGIPFRINAAQRPVVCRSAVEGHSMIAAEPKGWAPDVLR